MWVRDRRGRVMGVVPSTQWGEGMGEGADFYYTF